MLKTSLVFRSWNFQLVASDLHALQDPLWMTSALYTDASDQNKVSRNKSTPQLKVRENILIFQKS